MKRVQVILAGLFLAAALQVGAAAPSWERVRDRQPVPTEHVDADDVIVTSHAGYIYVTTSKPIEIKIFSILGQLIKQEKIPAGTFRYRLESKGIYIVKAETVTKKVTI